MFGAERTRTLLGPADPARNAAVGSPLVSARELIDRAGATETVAGRRRAHPTRRMVLAAGTLAVAVGAVAVLQPFGEGAPETAAEPPAAAGLVLVPVAYQFDEDPPAAGPQLRMLADKIKDAAYDHQSGRYMYHHTKLWGDPVMTSADGRHHIAFASETKIWKAADGTGNQVMTQLEPQYPDQESRDYWQRESIGRPAATGTPAPKVMPLPPEELRPPSADPSELRERLKVEYGAGRERVGAGTLYGQYVVPA